MPPKKYRPYPRASKEPLAGGIKTESETADHREMDTKGRSETLVEDPSAYSEVKLRNMNSYLLIVESPSKIAKIQSYLGKGYRVVASCGHIRYIKSLKDIDTEHQFRVTYHPMESKRSHIAKLRETVANYAKDRVMIATDNDREGEAIGYHLCMVLDLPLATTPRIVFNEITASALQKAVCHPQRLNMSLVYSAMARQVLDVLIGFKVSPVLWKYIYSSKTRPLSAGRCQTPALRLVYEHSLRAQTSEISYRTTATTLLRNDPTPFVWTLSHEGKDADEVRAFFAATPAYKHIFLGMGPCKVSRSAPPVPLNTSRLLQRAASTLHWSPKQVMSVAQQLYQHGHITYMRTESTQYSREFLTTAAAYIQTQWPDHAYVHPQLDRLANVHDNMPHEAVRVTHLEVTELPTTNNSIGEDITDGDKDPIISGAAAQLYRFLWKHTVESCMTESLSNTYLLKVSAPLCSDHTECVYEHTLSVPTHLGWKAVGVSLCCTPEKLSEFTLRSDSSLEGTKSVSSDIGSVLLYFQCLAVGSVLDVHTVEARVIERGRSGHYTEAGLIQALEDRGIGRPSTFATFVDTIQERGYVTKRDVPGTPQDFTEFIWSRGALKEVTVTKNLGAETAKLVLEPLGHVCIEFLLAHFGELFDYSYTESMERDLDADLDADTWYGRCQHTLDDVTRMLQSLAASKKKNKTDIDNTYRVADADDCRVRLMENGMVVVRSGTGSAGSACKESADEFLPMKSGQSLDMNRLSRGEYMLRELVEYTHSYLGDYQGRPVNLCTGPYGHYVQWAKDVVQAHVVAKPAIKDQTKAKDTTKAVAKSKDVVQAKDTTKPAAKVVAKTKDKDTNIVQKSLKHYAAKPLSEFTLTDAIEVLEGKHEGESTEGDANIKIIRALNDTMNVRRGKYGCYVYYLPPETSTPKFISLKKFPGKFLDVDVETVIAWAREQADMPVLPKERWVKKNRNQQT